MAKTEKSFPRNFTGKIGGSIAGSFAEPCFLWIMYNKLLDTARFDTFCQSGLDL
jgi:hypothetical protein